ncbi:MAG: hypothetical protein ACO2OR_00235 [Desulfurococcaceae archaeon]
MPERPLTAFALVLLGGAIVLITGVLVLAEVFTGRVSIIDVLRPTMPRFIDEYLDDMSVGILASVFGIIIIVGSILIVTGAQPNIRSGAIAALFFVILSLLLVAGGFYIGFLLVFVGSILALLWRPPT